MSKPDIWVTGEVNPDYPEWAEKRIAELTAYCKAGEATQAKLTATQAKLEAENAKLRQAAHTAIAGLMDALEVEIWR